MKKKGFTLIELLIAIVIMGILSGLGVTSYYKYSANAKDKVAKKNYETIIENMQLEFVRCELNEGAKIFKSHNLYFFISGFLNVHPNYASKIKEYNINDIDKVWKLLLVISRDHYYRDIFDISYFDSLL